jgi:hypothetical protein
MKLDDYKKCFNLSFEQFIAQHNIQPHKINKNVGYEKIADATRIELSDNEYFFFKNDKLKIIYISNDVLTKKLWSEFTNSANTNTPEETVRSRAGKTSNQLIFASQGLAASVTKGNVDFIEIYRPCTLQKYMANIYNEVQPFIR